ncbi:MAG: nitroreductase family protein [bacterium]
MARQSSYPISNIFLKRQTSRALSEERITDEELMTLFEAARWAPSAYNDQPWRFIYSYKGTQQWEDLFAIMDPFNQGWAKNAAVLVVLISNTCFEKTGKQSPFHTFDAGAAWMCMALQGLMSNIIVDAIGSFDREKTRSLLAIPETFNVELMMVIGKSGKKEALPPELQIRENPTGRKPLNEIVFKDHYK